MLDVSRRGARASDTGLFFAHSGLPQYGKLGLPSPQETGAGVLTISTSISCLFLLSPSSYPAPSPQFCLPYSP